MVFLTYLGNWQTILAVAALVGLLLIRSQSPQRLVAAKGLFLSIVLCLGCTELSKRAVGRDRPDIVEVAGSYQKPESPSFPSGHASCSMALAVALVLAIRRIKTPSWWWAIALIPLVCYGVAIGFTRLYLGVHWPTDVIAGWALGGACAFTGFFIADQRRILGRPGF
ncbi:MAG: phosphatase PAP2 family protein [Gemmataceae bacterium]